jgi:hypothetical protein
MAPYGYLLVRLTLIAKERSVLTRLCFKTSPAYLQAIISRHVPTLSEMKTKFENQFQ